MLYKNKKSTLLTAECFFCGCPIPKDAKPTERKTAYHALWLSKLFTQTISIFKIISVPL